MRKKWEWQRRMMEDSCWTMTLMQPRVDCERSHDRRPPIHPRHSLRRPPIHRRRCLVSVKSGTRMMLSGGMTAWRSKARLMLVSNRIHPVTSERNLSTTDNKKHKRTSVTDLLVGQRRAYGGRSAGRVGLARRTHRSTSGQTRMT
jgi:hypothetical protein